MKKTILCLLLVISLLLMPVFADTLLPPGLSDFESEAEGWGNTERRTDGGHGGNGYLLANGVPEIDLAPFMDNPGFYTLRLWVRFSCPNSDRAVLTATANNIKATLYSGEFSSNTWMQCTLLLEYSGEEQFVFRLDGLPEGASHLCLDDVTLVKGKPATSLGKGEADIGSARDPAPDATPVPVDYRTDTAAVKKVYRNAALTGTAVLFAGVAVAVFFAVRKKKAANTSSEK